MDTKALSFREELFAYAKVPLDSNFSLFSSKKATERLGIVFKSWQSDKLSQTEGRCEVQMSDTEVRPGTLRKGSSAALETLHDPRTKHFDITVRRSCQDRPPYSLRC
eukprot:scaffold436_cov267-Pinguiococcus_pyrenoidosus.AAC.10